jgi:hypothetical protein
MPHRRRVRTDGTDLIPALRRVAVAVLDRRPWAASSCANSRAWRVKVKDHAPALAPRAAHSTTIDNRLLAVEEVL